MSKSYTTNLTQEQWELIEPLIPQAKKGGRNREVDMWAVINAIFYIVTQGCTWRNLPILDFGLERRRREEAGHKGKWRILVCSLLNLKSKIGRFSELADCV